MEQDIGELAVEKLPALLELKYHGIHDATEALGDVGNIRKLFTGFQRLLFDGKESA